MSKRKGHDKSAEPSSPPLFRTFNDYPVEQVMEVARMLYASGRVQPFPPDEKSELKWNSLARQAFAFLDNLRNACEEIVRQRRATDTYRRAEKENARTAKLPLDVVPFNQAVKYITRQEHIGHAERKFKTFVLGCNWFRKVFADKRELRAWITGRRKDGFSRDEVEWLRSLFDKSYRDIVTAGRRERARKRAPRFNVKDEPIIREIIRAKASELL
jgi:hypothetical protein